MHMVAVPREAHERLIKAAQEVCQAPYVSGREAAVAELRAAGVAYDEAMRRSGYQRSHPHGLFDAAVVRRTNEGWAA